MADQSNTRQESEEISLETVMKWLALNHPVPSFPEQPSEQDWNASNHAKSELTDLQRAHQRELDELSEKIRLATLNGTTEVEDQKLKASMEHLNAQEKSLASELKLLRSKIMELWIQRETEEERKEELSNALELEERSLERMKEALQWDLNRFSELQTQLHDVETSLELLPSLIDQSINNNQKFEQTIFEAQDLLKGEMKTMIDTLTEKKVELELKKALASPNRNMELQAKRLALGHRLSQISMIESRLSRESKYMEAIEKADQDFDSLAEQMNADLETCHTLVEARNLRKIPTQDAEVQTEEE